LVEKELRQGAKTFESRIPKFLNELDGVSAVATTKVGITEHILAEETLNDYVLQPEDILEKHTVELENAQKELRQVDRFSSIGCLVSVVAHELRNPLSVMKNSAFYLSQRLGEDADEKIKRHLHLLDRGVDQCSNLLNDLLDFARGSTPLNLKSVDMNGLIDDALARIESPSDVEVEKVLGNLPVLHADPDMILRIFLNLISNAVDAMPNGGVITLETSQRNGFVEVSMRDTGIGIPEENREKLFTPLFSTKPNGIGLGLYITKKLVEAHGGTIMVESKKTEGTTFTVMLPIAEEG